MGSIPRLPTSARWFSFVETRLQFRTCGLTCFTLLLLAWHAVAQPVLERGNGPEPDSLDPARAQGLSAHQVLRDLYEGLFVESGQGAPVAGVARSWTVDDSGLHWTFELDEAARYADGRPVLAMDFVLALNRALDPATGAPYASALLPIAGAAERLSGSGQALAVTAVAPHTLHIRLVRPSLDLPVRLSLPIAFPVDLEQLQAISGRAVANGNGPYRLVEWRPGAWLELAVNPHHKDAARLGIRRVRFHVTDDAAAEARRFEAGELHLTETVPPQPLARLRERYGEQLRVSPSLGTFFLGYNLRRVPFAEQPQLREALSLVLDRELLVRIVTGTGELPAHGLLPPQLGGAAAPPGSHRQRIAQAMELYHQAGYSMEQPLEVELRYNSSSLNRRLMLAVAAMWQEHLGVRTRLRHEDWKVFVRNRRAGLITQVFRGGWNADFADPLNFLELFESGSPLNMTGYADPQFDVLLSSARHALSMDTRQQQLQQAHAHLQQAHAYIPLFHYTSKHLVSPLLEGFEANPLDHHPTRKLSWRSGVAP